jgi:hypothetical protein
MNLRDGQMKEEQILKQPEPIGDAALRWVLKDFGEETFEVVLLLLEGFAFVPSDHPLREKLKAKIRELEARRSSPAVLPRSGQN